MAYIGESDDLESFSEDSLGSNAIDLTDDEHDSNADFGIIQPYQFEPERCSDDSDVEVAHEPDDPVNGRLLTTDWRNRYTAYRQFVRWCWGYLSRRVRVRLPSCVVSIIHQKFPSESYIGFKESGEPSDV